MARETRVLTPTHHFARGMVRGEIPRRLSKWVMKHRERILRWCEGASLAEIAGACAEQRVAALRAEGAASKASAT